jgi:hypothetical protein
MANKNLILLAIATIAISYSASGQTPPFHQAPPIGADTSAAILIVVTDAGITVKTDPTQGPYDEIEDTLVAVQNNSSKTVFSLQLSSPNPIFGFDGDGICTVSPRPTGCPFPGATGYEGPGVTFTSINPTKTAGTINFAGGLAPGKSRYFGLEENIIVRCSPLSGVPLLKQGGSVPWRSDPYDSIPGTISVWGCNLTACAMLINYHAVVQGVKPNGVQFSTDPRILNNWLKSHKGYDLSGGVDGYAVAKYARENGVSLNYQGRLDKPDDFVVDSYLCAGNPVVLKVPHGNGHFVLATGQTVLNGTDTFLINDPGFANTTLQGYNYKYLGVRKYSSSPTPPQAILITAHSPIELLIKDPLGNQTGFDPTSNQEFREIPNGSYSAESIADDEDVTGATHTPECKVLDLPIPSQGIYNLRTFGIGTGPFTIEFAAYDANAQQSVKTLSGYAVPGGRVDYQLQYSDTPGSQIVVTPLDVTPPIIVGMPATKSVLWPPNHKLIPVAVVSALDAATGVALFDVTATINGRSDPQSPDIVISGSGTAPRVVYLRAERWGKESERVYTVTATATDGAGNITTATATWIVPHDQGK